MTKIAQTNVDGINYAVSGASLTGTCSSPASDFMKLVTLTDSDSIEDGVTIACTFVHENSAGTAPSSLTLYSADQIHFYTDAEMTEPYALAPSGCFELTYTGSGNAYSYVSYPVVAVGTLSGIVSAPVCDSHGKVTSRSLWKAGDVVFLQYKSRKFFVMNDKQQVENEVFSMLDHRNIFRGRCLNGDKNTLYPTTPFPDAPKFTGLGYTNAEVLAMITDGSFRDVWTGDYFIDFNDNNRVYRILDLDAYYNRGNRTVVNKHHIVVVPDNAMDNTPWNTSGNTSGGYSSSTIRSVMEGASVQGKFESFFGSSHLIPMEALVPTGESGWAWSQKFSGWTPKTLPMTEVEVYGSSVFGNGFQTGTGCSQLAGFKLEPRLAVGMRYDYWLMSIYSSSNACGADAAGGAGNYGVPASIGCRPRVLIG